MMPQKRPERREEKKAANIFDRKIGDERIEEIRIIGSSDIPPGTIKQRHITDGYIIVNGLSANRPSGSTHTKAYFATDTDVLSIWNGSSWVSTTLT